MKITVLDAQVNCTILLFISLFIFTVNIQDIHLRCRLTSSRNISLFIQNSFINKVICTITNHSNIFETNEFNNSCMEGLCERSYKIQTHSSQECGKVYKSINNCTLLPYLFQEETNKKVVYHPKTTNFSQMA